MGHIGFTPQSVHQLGGFKVQGKNREDWKRIKEEAHCLEELGAFAIVLECLPQELAMEITAGVSIPTIGIGAGIAVDGQILVFNDLLGMDKNFHPKFLRQYLAGYQLMEEALNRFDEETKNGKFPHISESYHSQERE